MEYNLTHLIAVGVIGTGGTVISQLILSGIKAAKGTNGRLDNDNGKSSTLNIDVEKIKTTCALQHKRVDERQDGVIRRINDLEDSICKDIKGVHERLDKILLDKGKKG